MRKFKLVKSMSKITFALCIALSIFVYSSATALAGVHTHIFDKCCEESGGYSAQEGTHSYVYGYDHNNEPIYMSCTLTYHYKYCHYVCKFCDIREPGVASHLELKKITHSDIHP